MKDCKKLKIKAIIGVVIFLAIFLIPKVDNIMLGLAIVLMIASMILGIILVVPYVNCLEEFSKKRKGTFKK